MPPRRTRTGRARRRPPAPRRAPPRCPDSRFAPAPFRHSRTSGPRIAAAIAQVVVLPFVAETAARAAAAAGRRAGRPRPGRAWSRPPRPGCARRAPMAGRRGARAGRRQHGWRPSRPRGARTHFGESTAARISLADCANLMLLWSVPRASGRGCKTSRVERALRADGEHRSAQARRRSGRAFAVATTTTRSSPSSGRAPSGWDESPRCASSGRPGRDVHPQTVIDHFGVLERGETPAGLTPRRFATREELLGRAPASSATSSGRPPPPRDLDLRRGRLPSKSLYWHTFGSLTRGAARGRVRHADRRGAARARASSRASMLARELGRLPKFADWAEARKTDASRSSPSGRSTGCSRRAAARGRRSSSSSASCSSSRVCTSALTGRSRRSAE